MHAAWSVTDAWQVWTLKEKIAQATGNAVLDTHMAVSAPSMVRLPYGQTLTNTVADMDKMDWAFSHGASPWTRICLI